MNRKNTILIAVLINAGLLAVLMIVALTTQDELPPASPVIAEAPLVLPQFDSQFGEKPVFSELPLTAAVEVPPTIVEPEPVVHPLPALVSEAPAPVIAAPLIPVATPPYIEVKVKKGDNLEKIAKLNRTTVDQILKLNNMKNSFLKIGQILKVPTEKTLPQVADKKSEGGPEYYTMKVGDNPWAIAMKHHMKVEELLRLNGLNEERARKLKPGDRLRIR